MARDELRLYGDPFAEDAPARGLRELLRRARARSIVAGLCLTVARGTDSGRAVALSNGAREFTLRTRIGAEELQAVLAAVAQPVAASAPLCAFGDLETCMQAALEWPDACVVLQGETDLDRMIDQVVQSLRRVPRIHRGIAPSDLEPFLGVPEPPGRGVFLHVAHGERADGTDLAIHAFAALEAGPDAELRILVRRPDPALEAAWRAAAGTARVTWVAGDFTPALLSDVDAIVLPWRELVDATLLTQALASGRPVLVSRFGATAPLLAAPGICLPIGGRLWQDFAPDPRAIVHAMQTVRAKPEEVAQTARRARNHVVTRLRADQPRPPLPEPLRQRPLVVLEAPYFSRSSAGELSAATAQALLRRGRVDLRLVASVPFSTGLAAFRTEHPELVPLLARRLPTSDLWISAGWPPRADRPDTNCWALRFDWEYGAIPTELTPLVPQEADRVIVHSRAVRRAVAACGRPLAGIEVVPHGVRADVFHPRAEPLAEVVAFKRGRRALLFVGGLVWRKGIDVLLRELAEHWRRDQPICLVVKSVGAATSYAGYELGELVRRFAGNPRAVETLCIERDLTPQEMAGLYRACDLLVHPYRGEGFGMPVLEARACGLPVLVTKGGSTDDFVDDTTCVAIPADRRPVELPGPTEGRPWVLEPDQQAFTLLFREVLLHLDAMGEVAREQAVEVPRRWSWEAAAAALERIAFGAQGSARARRPAPKIEVTA